MLTTVVSYDLQARGVEEIFIACIDCLTGFKEAIHTIFPKTEIQRCIIPQIRHSLQYVAYKDRKAFVADLKQMYQASTREAAEGNARRSRDRMNIKQLLLRQTHEAYAGEPDMSLMAALADLTPGEAAWRLNETTWTIEEILYHVASCKLDYCQEGFGRGHEDYAKPLGDLAAMLALLDHAHQYLVQCLEHCSVADLVKPIPLQ